MRKRPYSPKRPRKVRLPKAPKTHWLDRHEAEREQQDEALRRRIEASERERRSHG